MIRKGDAPAGDLGILDKLELPLDALLCGSPLSIQAELRNRQPWEHHKLEPYNSDCSGKHCKQVMEVQMDEELRRERCQRSQAPESEPRNYRNGY